MRNGSLHRSELGSLLTTWQLTDSAFPSGAFTLSHGLEAFVQEQAIDADTVAGLLDDLLLCALAPADATALALAHRGAADGNWETVVGADVRLHASKLSRELRQASLRVGGQLLSVVREVVGSRQLERLADLVASQRTPGTQAVVAGVAYAGAGVSRPEAVAADLFALSASFAGAAMRLRLVDHRGAQRLLRARGPTICRATTIALRGELEDIGGCAPLIEVMSARHERAEARLFAS
jgi:urease accessory protein